MWSCPYCGGNEGIAFQDQNLQGMLCLESDCGRFDEMESDQTIPLSEQVQSGSLV